MKSKVKIFILFLGAILFSINLSAQENKMITLEVDTENINKDNIEETATFGQPAETRNKDFSVDVKRGDVIIWQGKATPSSGGLVSIKLFKHEDGIELLGTNRIKDQNDAGVIVGKVQEGAPGDIEKYTLRFQVKKRGSQNWDTYEIDPKLMVVQ